MLKNLQNESKTDRLVRIVLAVILALVTYLFTTGVLQIVLYVASFILLFTGVTGFCLIYKLFGIKTNK